MAPNDEEAGAEEASSKTPAEGNTPAFHRAVSLLSGLRRKPWRVGGGALALAAVVAGAVFTFGPSGDEGAETAPDAVGVTYKVTGNGVATITYSDGGSATQSVVDVKLPWSQKARVTPGKDTARVSIVLGEDGGRAACSVAVRGENRQRSTAYGSYGRASCSSKVAFRSADEGPGA